MAQDLKRPAAESDGGANYKLGCAAQSVASSSMSLSYDAKGLATSSGQAAESRIVNPGPHEFSSASMQSRIFSQWQAASATYTNLTVNVNSSSDGYGTSHGAACVAYSLNSGTTWTSIVCDTGSGWRQTTNSLTISPTQNLALLQVGICVQGGSSNLPGFDDITVYDIWTIGTTSGSNSGNGSGAGQPQRGAVTVN